MCIIFNTANHNQDLLKPKKKNNKSNSKKHIQLGKAVYRKLQYTNQINQTAENSWNREREPSLCGDRLRCFYFFRLLFLCDDDEEEMPPVPDVPTVAAIYWRSLSAWLPIRRSELFLGTQIQAPLEPSASPSSFFQFDLFGFGRGFYDRRSGFFMWLLVLLHRRVQDLGDFNLGFDVLLLLESFCLGKPVRWSSSCDLAWPVVRPPSVSTSPPKFTLR